MKKRILAALLMLAMILSVVPAGALAADGDGWTELQKDLTAGSYTDQTAVSSGSYEYEVVGSDGSRQTVTVQAVTREPGEEHTVNAKDDGLTWARTLEPKYDKTYHGSNGLFWDKNGDLVRGVSYFASILPVKIIARLAGMKMRQRFAPLLPTAA